MSQSLDDLRWQRHLVLWRGWRIFVRPIRPDDELLIRDLLAHVSKEDLRLRFFDSIKEFSHQFIAGLTRSRLCARDGFVASMKPAARCSASSGSIPIKIHETGEYAILLRSDLKGRGLGWDLMQLIIEYAKSEGLSRIDGQILQENSVMLKMCRELGFGSETDAEDRGVCDVTLAL